MFQFMNGQSRSLSLESRTGPRKFVDPTKFRGGLNPTVGPGTGVALAVGSTKIRELHEILRMTESAAAGSWERL